MTLHIITVVFEDGVDLAITYASCGLPESLDAIHWIFVKKYNAALQDCYPRAKLLPSYDNGIYNAMNLAFAHLSPLLRDDDVVVFLNAGDTFVAEGLQEHLIAHGRDRPALSLAGVQLTSKGGAVSQRAAPAIVTDPGAVIYHDYPCHQATFYSGAFLKIMASERGYLYREELQCCADLELYLAALRYPILTSNAVTSCYDVAGFSSQQSIAIATEKQQLLRQYGGGKRWHMYSLLWRAKARLVEPKRRLQRLLRAVR